MVSSHSDVELLPILEICTVYARGNRYVSQACLVILMED